MAEELNFDNIRPYTESEAREAIQRITQQIEFQTILDYIFEKKHHDALRKKAAASQSIHEFQREFMKPLVQKIQQNTSDGVSSSGFEKLSETEPRLFIANHRDITLDSSILANQLVEHGLQTCEVTWGDNLMVSPFVVDLGKINRMITVFREGSPREMLIMSKRLSAYIRKKITQNKQSVWIAQGKGRTKDGNDQTDIVVLKMLTLSGEGSLLEKVKALNMTPATISFEWEPCDALKVKELYISRKKKYVKEAKEDLNSIIGGILGEKGHIHLAIGQPVNELLNDTHNNLADKDLLKEVSQFIDQDIYRHFKLWPTHYLAYDTLNNTNKFADHYTVETKEKFETRQQKALERIASNISDRAVAEKIFLSIYAAPVINKIKTGSLQV